MPADGSDFSQDDACGYADINEIKNSYRGAAAPGSPATGCLFEDTGGPTLKVWNGVAWAAVVANGGNAKDGMIVPFCPGYFGDGGNGSYQYVLGSANTVAGANAYLNPLGWYVCDGAVPNEGDSAIWDQAGRYLPNLTDDRFIMGDTVAGGTGGSNTNSHTHDVDCPNTESGGPSATVEVNYDGGATAKANDTHTHDVDVDSKTSSAASNTENRPKYLGCLYIVKVK